MTLSNVISYPLMEHIIERESIMEKSEERANSSEQQKRIESKIAKLLIHPWFCGFVCSFFASLVVYFCIQIPLSKLTREVDTINGNIQALNSNINSIQIHFDVSDSSIHSGLGNVESGTSPSAPVDNPPTGSVLIGEQESHLLESNTEDLVLLSNSTEMFTLMSRQYNMVLLGDGSLKMDEDYSEPPYMDTIQDMEKLRDKYVLAIYNESGQDYYFYGKINDDGLWDGLCRVNTYVDGELRVVMDADFRDGRMQHRLQAYKSEKGTWVLSDRDIYNSYSSGISWVYPYIKYEHDFNVSGPTSNDIISFAELQTWITDNDLNCVAYYSGNIADGTYNDDTGDAYYIRFFDDKSVMTLYKGQFKNGSFHDETGNAFWISKALIEQRNYIYFKGVFIDGNPDLNAGTWNIDVSKEEIDYYIKENKIPFIWPTIANESQ